MSDLINLNDLLKSDLKNPDKSPSVIVVRLTTSVWHDSNGAYIKRSLRILRRKSAGYNFFLEDCNNSSAEEVLMKMINLDECKDGIYEIDTCNLSTDWETGYVDDYDYCLKPYEEKKKRT